MRLFNLLLIAIVGLVSIGIALFVSAYLFFGMDTKISYGTELGSWHRSAISEITSLSADETIEMFYSTDIFLPKGDGNLLTSVGIYSWHDYAGDGKVTVDHAAFADIAAVEPAYSTSWLEDTTVTITTIGGDTIFLVLSIEDGRDRIFVKKLTDRVVVKAQDAEPAEPEPQPEPQAQPEHAED